MKKGKLMTDIDYEYQSYKSDLRVARLFGFAIGVLSSALVTVLIMFCYDKI